MTEKKHLLVIADAFPPDFAPRMGFLCKNLEKQNDWDVTVVAPTVGQKECDITFNKTEIHKVDIIESRNKKLAKLKWLLVFFMTLLFDKKSLIFTKKAKEIIKGRKFDAILCSTYYTFPLPTAQKLAEEMNIPFVADLRDIAEEYKENDFFLHKLPNLCGLEKIIPYIYKKQSVKRRNKALRKASAVISVSQWHTDTISKYNPNTQVIYNGYDNEIFIPEEIHTTTFNITHTGRLYNESIRDPKMFFCAIEKALNDNPEMKKHLSIRWHIDEASKPAVMEATKKHNLEEYTAINGFVKLTEVPRILNESSVVLVFSNKTEQNGTKGIMTTKFFEALGCRRPILCVKSDEDILEQTIIKTNSGVAARTVTEAENFILKKYEEWKQNGCTKQEANENGFVFSRSQQAQQYLELLNRLTEKQ
ncbi:MAG: glycosyltransferase [Paludibacteraceae bacterium]|nr:glycosyltransferase [Paludibacteraceae bacterium]